MKSPRAILLLSIFSMSIFASDALAQSGVKGLQLGTPLPQVVITPTPQPTPPLPAFAQPRAARKPIPLAWKLAIVATALLISLGVLHFATRAWRKWNLFDRQYRFPSAENVPLRLGAARSGGCMATIDFRRESSSEDA
jgi:hypothetical protein